MLGGSFCPQTGVNSVSWYNVFHTQQGRRRCSLKHIPSCGLTSTVCHCVDRKNSGGRSSSPQHDRWRTPNRSAASRKRLRSPKRRKISLKPKNYFLVLNHAKERDRARDQTPECAYYFWLHFHSTTAACEGKNGFVCGPLSDVIVF